MTRESYKGINPGLKARRVPDTSVKRILFNLGGLSLKMPLHKKSPVAKSRSEPSEGKKEFKGKKKKRRFCP